MADGVEIRAQIDTETVRGLQLINGGMAAGLVTLLPAILRDPNYRVLGSWMIVAVCFGGFGLATAVIHNRLRRKCSLEYDKDKGRRDRAYATKLLVRFQSQPGEPRACTRSVMFMWASLLLFLFGARRISRDWILAHPGR